MKRLRLVHGASILVLWLLTFTSMGCQNESPVSGGTPAQQDPMAIQDIDWQLSQVGGRPAETLPGDTTPISFRLNSAGKRVTGYSGLNRFNGAYEISTTTLKFGPQAMTRRAGPAHLMQQESAFSAALANTASWRAISQNEIELLDSTGQSLARFMSATTP
jgi:heat shock protein HslJ